MTKEIPAKRAGASPAAVVTGGLEVSDSRSNRLFESEAAQAPYPLCG
jgi:hypothetical protein